MFVVPDDAVRLCASDEEKAEQEAGYILLPVFSAVLWLFITTSTMVFVMSLVLQVTIKKSEYAQSYWVARSVADRIIHSLQEHKQTTCDTEINYGYARVEVKVTHLAQWDVMIQAVTMDSTDRIRFTYQDSDQQVTFWSDAVPPEASKST